MTSETKKCDPDKEDKTMMNLNEYKTRVITDYNSPAWELLERVLEELQRRGVAPFYVNGFHVPQAYNKEINLDCAEVGTRFANIETVYRHNGTDTNVSVKIKVFEKQESKYYTRTVKVFETKVPGGASDKVINNRVNKALENM